MPKYGHSGSGRIHVMCDVDQPTTGRHKFNSDRGWQPTLCGILIQDKRVNRYTRDEIKDLDIHPMTMIGMCKRCRTIYTKDRSAWIPDLHQQQLAALTRANAINAAAYEEGDR